MGWFGLVLSAGAYPRPGNGELQTNLASFQNGNDLILVKDFDVASAAMTAAPVTRPVLTLQCRTAGSL